MKHKLATSFLIVAVALAIIASPAAANGRPEAANVTYIAKKGDTYADLSWKYGVSIDRLLAANGLARGSGEPLDSKRFWLEPGQSVSIPVELGSQPSLVAPFIYTAQPGDTLGLLSMRFEIAAWAVAKVNGISGSDLTAGLTPGVALFIPAGPHVHKMDKGETLAAVAKTYGVSEAYLLKVNNLTDRSQASAGALITIPVQYDRAPSNAATAPAASAQPTAAPAASSGPLTIRWVAQKTGWAVNEVGPTATFFVEFKGGKALYRVWTPQWGTIKTGDPYTYTDGSGEVWTRIEFSVTARCGETFRLEPNVTDAAGANVWTLREFTAECR